MGGSLLWCGWVSVCPWNCLTQCPLDTVSVGLDDVNLRSLKLIYKVINDCYIQNYLPVLYFYALHHSYMIISTIKEIFYFAIHSCFTSLPERFEVLMNSNVWHSLNNIFDFNK